MFIVMVKRMAGVPETDAAELQPPTILFRMPPSFRKRLPVPKGSS